MRVLIDNLELLYHQMQIYQIFVHCVKKIYLCNINETFVGMRTKGHIVNL